VTSERPLLAVGAGVFLASALGTVAWCGAMAGGMPMPGGWNMSMAWMRMSGQSWPAAFAMFLGMWIVMMVAMMTPALVPMLLLDRAAARGGTTGVSARQLRVRTALVAAGYFATWTAFGAAAYPVGVALAAAEMRWPALSHAVPLGMGVVLVVAGALQFTPWKARHLARCREADASCAPAAGARAAWSHGLVLGVRCVRCCLGLMLALLALGVMDLALMTVVALAITAERVLPRPVPVARVTGVVALVAGAVWLARAAGAR